MAGFILAEAILRGLGYDAVEVNVVPVVPQPVNLWLGFLVRWTCRYAGLELATVPRFRFAALPENRTYGRFSQAHLRLAEAVTANYGLRIDPIYGVPLYLLIGGAGAVTGIWLGGKGADRNLGATLLIVFGGQITCFALLLPAIHHWLGAAVMLFLASLFGFGFSTPVQLRILNGARAAPRLASTMVSTAYNIGIALGALLGAMLLTAGLDYALLPAVGVACSSIACVIMLVSLRIERRVADLPAG